VVEIYIFTIAGRLINRFGIKVILVGSLLLTALRWWMTGVYAGNWLILLVVQLTHAASFGLTHAASMQFIQHYFAPDQQSRAQALYVGGAFGTGGAVGALAAGYLWLDGAGAGQTFTFAAIASLLGALVTMAIDPKRLP
jgi:PPP family 3-phenylpropionic acid transporter